MNNEITCGMCNNHLTKLSIRENALSCEKRRCPCKREKKLKEFANQLEIDKEELRPVLSGSLGEITREYQYQYQYPNQYSLEYDDWY